MAELAEVSGKSIDEIKADVKRLAEEFQKTGDNIPLSYKKAYDKIGVYSEKAEKKIKQSSEEAKDGVTDDADEMGKSHKKNSEKASSSWEKTFSVLGNVGTAGLKVFTAGTTAAVAGLSALGTAAVNTFADYEQLVGGSQLLFGEAYDFVAEKAQNAYKDVQMSQNEYLEQMNGFATGLKTALGGNEQVAAELASKIITAEADIVAATGNSQEAIQNAFNGIMKSNFTMLDNLQLGITPTKAGFQEVINKVNEWNEANGRATNYQIDNLADCQSALVDYVEMQGLAGYAAKESAGTISGSTATMKASWQNLLVGIADDSQNFDALIDNFVESASVFADNILPRVEDVLLGTGELVEKLLPVVVGRIPGIINNILPQLMGSGMNMVTTLINGIEANLPEIVNGVFLILQQFVTTFLGMLPQILEMGLFIIVQLALGIATALPELVPQIINVMLTIVQVLLDNIDLLIDAAIQIMFGLAEGLIQALPVLIERIPEIVIAIMDALIENAPKLLNAAYELIATLAVGLVTYLPKLLAKIPGLITTVLNKFNELVSCFDQVGTNIINGIWSGLSAGWNWLVDKVKGLASSLFNAAKEALDINSPSKKFEWLADMCIAGFDNRMDDFMNPNHMTRNINATLGVMKNNISGGNYIGSSNGAGNVYQNVYVNKEVATADELARAIRLESRYGMMRGVPVG